MSGYLYSLFDDKLSLPEGLVASSPQNLDSIAEKPEDQGLILRRIKQFEEVRPKVNYGDFKNFVFFNSALDYFNITGEKILNEYPFDGTVDSIEAFVDDLDGYQRYLVSVWPRSTGYLRFNPAVSASYVLIDDVGTDDGVVRTGMLSPGTGSFSLEFWCSSPKVQTGSFSMFVAQKVSGSGDGYSVFFSGSALAFQIKSGSVTQVLTTSFPVESTAYFACVYDNLSYPAMMEIYSGDDDSFPTLVASSSISIGSMYLGSQRFSIASGSISGKNTAIYSGSLDEVRVWNVPLGISDLSSSFNTKIHAQRNLMGLWRFNETGSLTQDYRTIKDSSGHRLNGRIMNYFPQLRVSGSIVPYDIPDLILSLDSSEVQAFVTEQQSSGSLYDRDNLNIITRLMPSKFFELEEFRDTEVLKNFLYILARQFDDLKVSIDQFLYVFRSNYTQFDQTPDALLEDIGRFFGWEFTGNFLNSSATQYILGRDVLGNLETNRELDVKLFEIKNEFWRRTLINLMYLYKTKGTRESVESLLRIYGVDRNFVRLKEYGIRPDVGIDTRRISAEKSVAALTFSGSLTSTSPYVQSSGFRTFARTIESRVCFPTTASLDMPATLISGSIWSLYNSASSPYSVTSSIYSPATSSFQILNSNSSRLAFWIYNNSTPDLYVRFGSGSASLSNYTVILPQGTLYESSVNWLGQIQAISSGSGTGQIQVTEVLSVSASLAYRLSFLKDAVSSTTGSLILSGSGVNLTLSGVGMFDENWYNVTVLCDPVSSSLSIDVRSMNDDNEIDFRRSTSQTYTVPTGSGVFNVIVGSDVGTKSQQWMQEFRVWDQVLGTAEIDDHVLNFQSYGTQEVNGARDLALHWRMSENVSADSLGQLAHVFDSSGNSNEGQGFLFAGSTNPYKKFLFDYEYIAPVDFGWNQDKIRVIDTTVIQRRDVIKEDRTLSLEFNMVDALNEDISQIISTMDNFNEYMGQPANRFRDTYPDLDALRKNYFRRLQGRLNFRLFADMLEFFDSSFIEMVRRLIPARADFLGDEFVVESHMLERPKLQWNYRRQQVPFQPEGVVKVYIRT